MVVGVRAPGKAEIVAELRHPDGALHRPEMRIRQRNVDGLQHDGMAHFPPVRGDHVGCRRKARRASELRQYLTAGIHAFRPAWVFTVGKDSVHVFAERNRFLQAPGPVGVERDPRVRESLFQRPNGFHFLFSFQDAALQLKIMEAVFFLSRFGKPDNGFGGKRLLMAEPIPGAARIRLGIIRQIRFLSVPDIKQIPEEAHLFPHHAIPEESGDGHFQVFPQKVKQRRFDRGQNMDAGPLVKGLVSPHIRLVFAFQPGFYLQQRVFIFPDTCADHQIFDLFQRIRNLRSPGNLPYARRAAAVRQDHDVSGKVRRVGAA